MPQGVPPSKNPQPSGRGILDAIDVPSGWEHSTAAGLLILLERSPRDIAVLPDLFDRIAQDRPSLQRAAAGFQPKDALRTEGQITRHRVPALLNALAAAVAPATLGIRLVAVTAALALRHETDADALAQIASAVITSDRPKARALTARIGAVPSISELLLRYQSLRSTWVEQDDVPHRTFDALWQRSLYEKLMGAVLAAAFQHDPLALEPGTELDAPPPPTSVLAPGANGNADADGPEIGLETYPSREPGKPRESNDTAGLAKANLLLSRRSSGNICRHPDDIVPRPLLKTALKSASELATRATADGRLSLAIDMISLQLVAITGCRVAELQHVVVDDAPSDSCCAVDIKRGLFLRREVRPAGAFQPEPDDHRWLATGGHIAIRLPHVLTKQFSALQEARGVGADLHPLRQSLSEVPDSSAPIATAVIHVADALEQVAPGIHVGANALRARLAAHLAARLGPEAAQIAIGDSLGMSTAAAYYYRSNSDVLTEAAWEYAETLYDDNPEAPNALPTNADQAIGSRAAVSDEQVTVGSVDARTRHRPPITAEETQQLWKEHAERAAAALAYATGMRINASLAAITIGDICPEYGLIALSDKQSTLTHAVRMAALGTTALGAIEPYVAFLNGVRRYRRPFASIAQRILVGEAPLFTLPGAADGVALDIDAFISKLLGDLADRPNTLRHHLNHALIRANIDPALRHQQLGWFITPATELGDGSPQSAIDFARQVSPCIDQYMAEHGWQFPKVTGTRGWQYVQLPVLRDWTATEREHERTHRNSCRAIQAAVMEGRSRILRAVRPRLKDAVAALLPDTRLNSNHWILERTKPDAPELKIDQALVFTLLGYMSTEASEPSTSIVARAELARILIHANRHQIAKAYVPSYQKFNFTSEPSPFLKGFAFAVRQAEWLRERVRAESCWHSPTQDACAAACRVMLGLILLTPYRTFDLARQIMGGVAHAKRTRAEPNFVRVPIGRSQVVVTGEAALLLAGWRTKDALPSNQQAAKYLHTVLRPIIGTDTTTANILDRLEGLARTAGRVELNGPERAFLLGDFALNVVEMQRSLSDRDDWPLRCAEPDTDVEHLDADGATSTAPPPPTNGSRKRVMNVTRLLNPDLDLLLPFTKRDVACDVQGRMSIVRAELDYALQTPSALTVGRAVTEYARFLTADSHEKGGKENALVTAHTYITRFAKPLADNLGDADLTAVMPEDMARAYAAILLRKLERKHNSTQGNYRRQVYDALRRFHHWLQEAHQLDDVEWADLAAIAGERFHGVDPGLVRPVETHIVLLQLEADTDALRKDPACSPDSLHESEQRELFATLLASNRCRPASVYGLTFGDIHLTNDGDWLHLRCTGTYGSVKTSSSLGFHRLGGTEWQRTRTKWVDWIAQARVRLGDDANNYPVFGRLGLPREQRPRERLTRRLGQLLRWATGLPDAHPYWFRKSGIIAAHRGLWANAHTPSALDTQRVLSEEGHIHEYTALSSYLHDPAVIFAAYLHAPPHLTAKTVRELAGIKPVTIESAWQRARNERESVRAMDDWQRVAIALGCADFDFAIAPDELRTDPPPNPLRSQSLRCSDIAVFITEAQRTGASGTAATRAGFTAQQSARVLAACAKWYERTGYALTGEHPTHRLMAPRPIGGSAHLIRVLHKDDPSALEDWATLADHWSFTLRGSAMRGGLPLVDRDDSVLAERLLTEVGLVPIVDEARQPPTLKPARPSASEGARSTSLTLWPVMAWVLAIIWVSRHLRAA